MLMNLDACKEVSPAANGIYMANMYAADGAMATHTIVVRLQSLLHYMYLRWAIAA